MGSPTLAKDAISGIDAAYAFQRITKITVTPQPNAVAIDFSTHVPTVPVVEIFRNVQDTQGKLLFIPGDSLQVVFDFLDAALGNSFTEHHARLDGLAQNTWYNYRITAGDGPLPAAVLTGKFRTGRRSANVVFSGLEIWNDGDPGLKGAGELTFSVGFYNGSDRQSGRNDFSREIDSGEIVDFPFGGGPALTNPNAPDSVAVYVEGVEHDGILTTFRPAEAPTPLRLPETPSHEEEDDFTLANAFQQFELPNDIGAHRINFILDSGPWGIFFKMNGWIDVQVTNPPPMFTKSLARGGLATGTTLLGRIGARQAVHTPSGKAYLFGLGPEGVIAQRLPRVSRRRRREWALIPTGGAESATLIARDERYADILTVADGTVRATRRSLDSAKNAPVEWTVLGQDMQPALTALRLTDGTAVLTGLTRGGEVRATLLRTDGSSTSVWTALGGHFVGRIAALAVNNGIELFAVTEGGEVHYTNWQPEAKAPGLWLSLGGKSVAHVVTASDEAGPHLVALTHQRELLSLSRREVAWSREWRRLGTLDDLELEERPAAPSPEPGLSDRLTAKKAARPKKTGAGAGAVDRAKPPGKVDPAGSGRIAHSEA